MVFLNRIGMFTAAGLPRRSGGTRCMVLAVFAALITPTPDVVTMLYLFVPMFGLYMLGIVVLPLLPRPLDEDGR